MSRRLLRRGLSVSARVSRCRFTREPLRSDDDDRLFNPLPPVASSPSTLLPANFRRGKREGEGRGAGEKEEEEKVLIAFVVVVVFFDG